MRMVAICKSTPDAAEEGVSACPDLRWTLVNLEKPELIFPLFGSPRFTLFGNSFTRFFRVFSPRFQVIGILESSIRIKNESTIHPLIWNDIQIGSGECVTLRHGDAFRIGNATFQAARISGSVPRKKTL